MHACHKKPPVTALCRAAVKHGHAAFDSCWECALVQDNEAAVGDIKSARHWWCPSVCNAELWVQPGLLLRGGSPCQYSTTCSGVSAPEMALSLFQLASIASILGASAATWGINKAFSCQQAGVVFS